MAYAQRPQENDEIVLFEADVVTRENSASPIVAEGDVKAYFGDQFLTSDRVTYDPEKDIVTASGNVTITDVSGQTFFADEVELTGDLAEEIELVREGYPEFDLEAYRNGDLTPVFFGSALKNFGVEELIAALDRWAPPPRPQPAGEEQISPDRDEVTGFIFKVQANMDPNHRDRIAFMRQVSGTFKRGMKLTPSGLGKPIAVHSPILFFAQDREIADTAEAGDIIGIPNHGTLRVGDTLSEKDQIRFTGLPNFAPEILRRVQLKDPTKTKQLRKALDDLSEEGVIQVFYPEIGAQHIVGVVGQLQLDVLVSRLSAEYKVEAGLEASPFATARWVKGDAKALADFESFNRANLARDRDGDLVFMAKSPWDVNYQVEKNPDLTFSATKER